MPIIGKKQKIKTLLRCQKDKTGFTLIELIVAIGIIGLILAITIPNLRLGQRRQQLKVSAGEVASNIREAQNMAVSGVTQNFAGETEARVPNFGYGIYFEKVGDTEKYIIFANDGQESSGKDYDTKEDKKIKEVVVTPKASFSENISQKFINFGIPGGFPAEVLNEFGTGEGVELTEGTYTISVSVPGLEKDRIDVIINTITGKVEMRAVKISD